VRPFCLEFLEQMSSLYEIVIFTAGVKEYADWVLDNIDKHGYIKHRLYREHTIIT
jgi:CTD small phosphatase-like protein 2